MAKLYIIKQSHLNVETVVFQRGQEEIYKRKCNGKRPRVVSPLFGFETNANRKFFSSSLVDAL